MYLRTPKRYQKQRRQVISWRWLWLWILTPLVVVAGYYLYENRAEFAPQVQQALESVANRASSGVATITAPTAMPTEDPTRRLTIANNAWQQGSIDEAVREYQAVLPSVPNDVSAHYRVTFGLLMSGKAEEALEYAEKTITANPFSSDAWAIRSQALNALGRQGEAIASAMQALQLDPNSARATAFLAEAYFDSNQIERAQTTVEKAMELDPESFEALYVYARINNESLYDFETAMEAFEQAYSLAPNMPYIGVELAWLHLNLQNPDEGYDLLEQIAEYNPENTSALYALAFFSYAAYGDPNGALDFLTRCINANPRSIACNYYMGTVQFGLGDNEAAAEAFMRVIDLGTTNSRHYLSAGRINAALNNCRAAVPLLQEGYRLEQEGAANPDRLLEFEDALRGCGVNTGGTAPSADATEEPGLEIEATDEPTA